MSSLLKHAGQFAFSAGCGLLDLVLPDACQGCQSWIASERRGLCETCRGELERAARISFCPRCGRSMSPLSIYEQGCAGCRSETFWNVAEVVRVGEYAGALRTMILRLKYRGERRDAAQLGRLLAGRIAAAEWFSTLDAVVPVPMHLLRRVQRPCNHAKTLADYCVRHLRRQPGARRGLGLRTAVVWRSRYSPSQTAQSSSAARFDNIRNCFQPRPWWHWPGSARLDGLNVCIVDNLLVSAATVTEVSKVLRRLGAKRIYAAVVARTPPPGEALRRVQPEPQAQARGYLCE